MHAFIGDYSEQTQEINPCLTLPEDYNGSPINEHVPSATSKAFSCFINKNPSFPHLPVTCLAFTPLIFQ